MTRMSSAGQGTRSASVSVSPNTGAVAKFNAYVWSKTVQAFLFAIRGNDVSGGITNGTTHYYVGGLLGRDVGAQLQEYGSAPTNREWLCCCAQLHHCR